MNSVCGRRLKGFPSPSHQDGVAKIGDVGMAKIMSDGYLTRDGALGTMAWAAPELLLGEKCELICGLLIVLQCTCKQRSSARADLCHHHW